MRADELPPIPKALRWGHKIKDVAAELRRLVAELSPTVRAEVLARVRTDGLSD